MDPVTSKKWTVNREDDVAEYQSAQGAARRGDPLLLTTGWGFSFGSPNEAMRPYARRHRQEMYSVRKLALVIANQFQVRFVNQRRGLQGVPGSLAS